MGFPNEIIASIIGKAVLKELDKEGLKIVWKPEEIRSPLPTKQT